MHVLIKPFHAPTLLHQHFKLIFSLKCNEISNSWKDITRMILTVTLMPGSFIFARAIATGGIVILGRSCCRSKTLSPEELSLLWEQSLLEQLLQENFIVGAIITGALIAGTIIVRVNFAGAIITGAIIAGAIVAFGAANVVRASHE